MTTANVAVTEGSGKNVATYSISEDAATKQIQRVEINDSTGAAYLHTDLATINTSINTSSTQLPSAMGTLATASSSSVTLSTSDAAPATPGTATATRGILGAQTYKAAGVTFTDTQQGSLQCDSTGATRVWDYVANNKYTGTAATDASRLPVMEPDCVAASGSPFTSSGAGNETLFDIDTTGYESIIVHVTTAGTVTHTFTTSNNQASTYIASLGYQANSSGSAAPVNILTSSTGIFHFPVTGKFFKDALTTQSVATTAYVFLRKRPVPTLTPVYATNLSLQTQGGSVGTSGPLVMVDAVSYGAQQTAVTTGQGIRAQSDLTGNLRVYSEFLFANLAATNGAGAAVKGSAGVLHSINVNTAVATATLSLYDAGSATNPIAVIDCGTVIGTKTFNVSFGTGLFWVLAGANANVTVSYR